MTRAENKAMQARVAVRVLAHQAARKAVKDQLRSKGVKVSTLSAKEITLQAEAWLASHPQMIAEARTKAAALGFAKFWQD